MIIKDFIGVYDNFMSKEYCENVITTHEDMAKIGLGVSERKIKDGQLAKDSDAIHLSGNKVMELTAELQAEFVTKFWADVYPKYNDKFPILTQADPHGINHLKTQKVSVGGGFHHWHFESSGKPDYNRLLNVFLFLNTVEEGGETEFLYYGRREKAVQGKLLIYPASFTHTHRGNPPISNTKYVLNGWVEF